MNLRRHTIENVCDETIAMLREIREQADELSLRACSDRNTYVAGGGVGYQAPTHADDGSRPGPTPGNGLNRREDRVELAAKHLMASLGRARTDARAAQNEVRRLRPLGATAATELAEKGKPGSGGHCGNLACGRWVSNAGHDRLKKGRCPSCYKWRREHDGEERPRERCHPETEEIG